MPSEPETGAGPETGTGPEPTTGPDQGTGTRTWEPGRRFMLRVAGLPIESVHALRGPGSRRWADDVLSAEESLRARGAELSDLLHDLVPATDSSAPAEGDETRRRALLNLRRQVFNNRLPADPEAAHRLVGALDPAAAALTGDWLRDRLHLEKLRSEGAALLATDLDRTRAALRGLLTEDRLRLGLLLASPTLDGQLDTYITKGAAGGRPDKRMRKIERSVLSYVYRTACKTSPFSTFTAVATGAFGEGDDATITLGEDWTSHVRLNVVVLARLAELITADPARRADLPVRLASGWGREDDRIRYVRRWVTAGDDATAVTFDAVKDRLFFLRRSGTLDRLLALFEGRPELRYHELVDWLSTEHSADPAQCETYVAALLQLGMVRVPCLDTDVHSPDPLRSFRAALREVGRPWADRAAARLDGPIGALDRFPVAGARERVALLELLREGLRLLQRQLGAAEATLPQTLLYEDVSAGRDVRCGLGAWTGPGGGELRSVERILPAFDLTLPQRVTFQGFFLARYGRGGRCDDLLGLVHDFHEDFFDQYLSFTAKRRPFDDKGEYVPEENWLNLPGIKALDDARRSFMDRMRALWAESGDTAEIRLDEEHLDEIAARLAPVSGEFAPQSHHLQLAREADGEPLIVLNRSYGGLSFPFSRFTHVYDHGSYDHGSDEAPGRQPPPGLSGALRATAASAAPDGAVLAEITGGAVTSNLNLHGRLTDYEIVCPGEVSTVPGEQRIHLDDLYVEHDPDGDRLRLCSHRLGREVVPVYLGYLVPLALPEIPRTLLLLSPTSMAPLDVWGGVPEGEARGGVTRRPRVRHGRLVLSRRSWSTTAAALPAHRSGAGDDERFLDWQRWRREHGLPERVFATVSGGPMGGAGAKPSYLDFDSPLSLTAFEALVKSPEDRVVLREMLPAEDGLHVRSGRGSHVAELAVETFTSTRRTKDAPTCQS